MGIFLNRRRSLICEHMHAHACAGPRNLVLVGDADVEPNLSRQRNPSHANMLTGTVSVEQRRESMIAQGERFVPMKVLGRNEEGGPLQVKPAHGATS